MPGMPSWMRGSRPAVLILAVLLPGAVSCSRAESEKLGLAGRSGPEALLAVAPADLPAYVRDLYRLRPDRRLLQAVAALQRLRTGTAPERVEAQLQGGRWRILADGEEAGVLSEIPTFEEATDLLARRAGPSPAAAHPSPAPDAGRVEQAVRQADAVALVGALSSPGADARSIAPGLAWLATLTVDHLDQADALLAEAWAWLATDRDPRSEALLARALGYEAAAARAGEKLAEDDPVRHYAMGDEPRLSALCAGRPADRPCRFLHLALLAERHQSERFRVALAGSPFRDAASPAILGLRTRLSEFDGGRLGSSLAETVMRPLGLEAAPPAARTRDFEAAVDRLAARRAGPVPAAAFQAWYRAVFYSGLYNEARFAVDQLASGPAAQELAASMKPAAGTGDELRRWLEESGRVLDGSTDMKPVAELLASARSLGAAPLFGLSVTICQEVASTDPLRRAPIPALFERLDTRPAHLVRAARVARRSLTSAWLYEKLLRAAAEAAPHLSEELPALAAQMSEDAARLREIAVDPAMPKYAQVIALDALAELGKADDAFVRARYEELAADPDGTVDWLVEYLEEDRGDLAGAVAALDAALARADHPLVDAYLRSEKARLQVKMGQPDRAWATIEPALATWKEDALLQGATVELARNRPESALELARKAMQRYPGDSSETAGLIARAHWRLGDPATAAKELAANPGGILGPWNRYLPEAFADAFATAPEEDARRAFSEMVSAGIPHRVLARAAIALGEKRGLGIALPLVEGLREPAPEWRDEIRLATYDLVLAKAGPDEALAWVRKAIPERSHNFALNLYQNRRYELLLGLFANGEEGESPRIVRLVKAAALLHLGETTGPRWDGLVAEILKEPADEFFSRADRMLVDPGDGAGMLASIADEDRASIGWIMGVKAAAAGRFADADAWFQVALESARKDQPPHAWSWVLENEWLQSDRSLELLAKRNGRERGNGAVSPAGAAR